MTCKANCAAYVTIKTPQLADVEAAGLLMLAMNGIDRYNTRFLDMSRICGIIIITIAMPILEMELDFLKKALRRFREQPLLAAANGNAGSMSKFRKRPKRRQR